MSDRRTLILDAAAEVIAERGFNQTSVEDVVRRAGLCGKSHFYHYFDSKEELGYAVLDRRFECFAESGLSLLRDPLLDPLDRLNRFVDSLVEAQAKNGCKGGAAFGFLAAELSDTHEGFRERIERVFSRWSDSVEALLWELLPRMRPDTETRRLAQFIIASLEGALMMSRVSREICVLEGVALNLKRFIAMHLVQEPGAAVDSAVAGVRSTSLGGVSDVRQ
jgi:TetR/AcrR family transcriptional repressor of nem operon